MGYTNLVLSFYVVFVSINLAIFIISYFNIRLESTISQVLQYSFLTSLDLKF